MKNITTLLLPLALLLTMGQVLLIFSVWQFLPPKLPLFYSRPWGETQLTEPIGLFLLPGFGIFIIIINFLFAKIVFNKKTVTKFILSATTLVCCLINAVGLVQIIRLVI